MKSEACITARAEEQRARALLAEGRVLEAAAAARSALRLLDRVSEPDVFAAVLTTYGIVWARLGRQWRAWVLLKRAIDVAEAANDRGRAGCARLSLIEELGEHLSTRDLTSIYRLASNCLQDSTDPSITQRVIGSAEKLIERLERSDNEDPNIRHESWKGFSFTRHIRSLERVVIERALRDAGGSVTRASRLLGFKHHRSLSNLLNSRHQELLKVRSPIRNRRRHLFSKPKPQKKNLTSPS